MWQPCAVAHGLRVSLHCAKSKHRFFSECKLFWREGGKICRSVFFFSEFLKLDQTHHLIQQNLNASKQSPSSCIYSLSYGKSIASFQASSPQAAIYCFLFQFAVPCLFFQAIQKLLTSTSFQFRHFQVPRTFSSIFSSIFTSQHKKLQLLKHAHNIKCKDWYKLSSYCSFFPENFFATQGTFHPDQCFYIPSKDSLHRNNLNKSRDLTIGCI